MFSTHSGLCAPIHLLLPLIGSALGFGALLGVLGASTAGLI